MTNITYISHPNPSCKGNPLIEGLGYPMLQEEVEKACDDGVTQLGTLNEVPVQYHSYYIRSAIDNLAECYIARDEVYALYEKLRRMIEAGYINRNPADPVLKNKMLTAVHQDDENQHDAVLLKTITGQDIDSMLRANGSFLLAGLSGAGKTSLMLRILKLIQNELYHSTYITPDGNEIEIEELQIPYLYVQIHNRKGQKAFLKTVIEAIQVATKIPYLTRDVKNVDSVDDLIRLVRKLMLKHYVGILVIDEAQNIAPNFATDDDKKALIKNEKTSIKFIEEIFNRIGVPLFFIGTLSTLKLFGKEVTISRRTLIDGSLLLLGADVEGGFWNRFFKEINLCHLLDGKHDPEEHLKRHLHSLTQGIPAIAISLMRAVLSHMSKFDKGEQGLTIKALSHVFRQQFSELQKPLKALKNEKYHLYEDLAPLADLVEINKEISKQLAESEFELKNRDKEKKEQLILDTDKEAEAKVEKELNKVRKAKVKSKRSKVPVMDAKLAAKIGTKTLLKAGSGPKSSIISENS
ncbi:ATP-binding protein [Pseudoalteromonas shioyasakiensis]|uniref:ATP-binding protein n=1 Tax=Pseudoalteromonas shioyasakiensis TaxID=1190813 RepID=UPI00078469DD|nr:ATP-binding protein [Pseudoalteromonas shioyasakiensis]